MPTENNPWSGELKAKRQKSQNKGIVKSDQCSVPHSPRSDQPEIKSKTPVQDSGFTSNTNTYKDQGTTTKPRNNDDIRQSCDGDTRQDRSGCEEDGKQQDTESTGDMLKFTRKNLRPVAGQAFKRSDSQSQGQEDETPVDRLLRQGSLDTPPAASSAADLQTRAATGISGTPSSSRGEGN